MVDGRRACLSKLMFLDDLFRSRYEKSTNDLYTFLFSFCENTFDTGFFQKNGSNFYYGSKVKFSFAPVVTIKIIYLILEKERKNWASNNNKRKSYSRQWFRATNFSTVPWVTLSNNQNSLE